MILSLKPKPLIVTQQLIIAADLYLQLSKLNYDVLGICNCSDELLNTLITNPPSVVLIDLGLKGAMDATELGGRVIKEYGIPVIFLNPGMDKQTIESAFLTNPSSFVNIPYEITELKTKIESLNQKPTYQKLNLIA